MIYALGPCGLRRCVALAALLISTSLSAAAETVTYSYDALGRLTSTSHSGGDNDGMATTYQFDAAGNRTRLTVTGSRNRGLAEAAVIVVPLNGFTIIPIGP